MTRFREINMILSIIATHMLNLKNIYAIGFQKRLTNRSIVINIETEVNNKEILIINKIMYV